MVAAVASSFRKEVTRSIRHTLGRFVAIAAIVALGSGFYAGLRMTAPDMNFAADAYYDATALMDIRVVSTLGLTDADVEALRDVAGVEAVMPAYETDVMATIGGEQYAVRVHSLSASAAQSVSESDGAVASDDPSYLNRLTLAQGRWPQAAGECVISADRVMNSPTELGDVITITEGSAADVDAVLNTRTYRIVGYVHASYYVSSTAMGSTTLGSGTVQQFMYVPEDDFAEDYPYTEAFVKVAGASELDASSDAYDELVAEVLSRIEVIAPEREQARSEGLRASARDELDKARADYERERASVLDELAQAQSELESALRVIEQGESDIAAGQASYDAGVVELARATSQAQSELAAAERALDEAQAELDARAAELAAAATQLSASWEQAGMSADQAPAAQLQLKSALREADDALAALGQALALLDETSPEYAQISAQIDQVSLQRGQLAGQLDALEELMSAQERFDEAQAALNAGAAEVEQGFSQLAAQRVSAQAQLERAQGELDRAQAQLESYRVQLEQGKADYVEGLARYEQAQTEAEEGFASAEDELARAEDDIAQIDDATWLVMDRSKNYGAVSFSSDAERVDHIAAVFPFIFFLVAALVALTTMTRMVEEERVLIGTYKALGYTRARITSKYLIYAAAASVLGAVVGIAVLANILPAVIMEAYSIIYFVPHGALPIDWPIACASAALGAGVTLVATWAAATATLREQPASLMQPRAPKAGKRILLEHIGPLWRRLSFSRKVTCRNLFRYKKRFAMTVIGIAGCTALLLTGLGLQDSINDIIDKHFGELVRYNVVISGDEGMSKSDRDELRAQVSAQAGSNYAETMSVSMVAVNEQEGTSDFSVTVVVAQDGEKLQDVWVMRERVGHAPLTLGTHDVIVTEKLARELGAQQGDAIELAAQDDMGNATDDTVQLTVSGIMENYVSNYVIMGQGAYEEAFGEAPDFTTVYALVSSDEDERAALSEQIRDIEGVKTIAYNDETIETYRTMLRSVNMVVVVLVVAAAALAFIVLYNLTNINITERVREIATLKVLGFTPREVDLYIYRETAVLSVIGCALGLVLGVFLESFVIVTAEVNQVMFGRDIHLASFVWAFVLTMVFTLLVMVAMRGKLARVNMVESLKSNE